MRWSSSLLRFLLAGAVLGMSAAVTAAPASEGPGEDAMADASAAVAARLVLAAPRVVHAEPLPGLVPGGWWRLEIEPPLPESPAAAAAPLLAAARRAAMADRLDAQTVARVEALAGGLEDEAARASATPLLAGRRVVVEEPLVAADLRDRRARFVSATEDAPGAFRVADAPRALRHARSGLGELACSPAVLHEAADGSWQGTYAAPGGPLPLRVRLPADGDRTAPVVVLVDGLTGSMERFLAEVGDRLSERGLTVLAVELPHHGERADGVAYLDPAQPAELARRLPAGAVDVMAAIRQVRECGLAFPAGGVLAPRAWRYLGFSLGGMTGVLLRAAEPDFSRMVWVAPSADLADWLLLQAARARGVPLVSCRGGGDDGKDCFGHGRCAPPGVCAIDPLFDMLGRQLRFPWLVAAAGADPADYAASPVAAPELLIVSGSEDGILHPRQTKRLTDLLGPARESGPLLVGEGWRRREFAGLGHGLLSDPRVAAMVFDFLAAEDPGGASTASR